VIPKPNKLHAIASEVSSQIEVALYRNDIEDCMLHFTMPRSHALLALADLQAALDDWTVISSACCKLQLGWLICERGDGVLAIQRDDDLDTFADDNAALREVKRRARAGDQHCIAALRIVNDPTNNAHARRSE
jgi:hypothetical protein